ncbi:MAG TPA: cupin domain-containing protein [Pseudonocardia sp.]|jgi:quercetin dioxygenase-like cupin family protein
MTTDDITIVSDLLRLAPIEPGKLGHHTALDVAGARVIVLAFPHGHLLKEHQAPRPIIMQALDGLLRVSAAGQVHDLRPGELIHLAASVPHAVEALADSRLSLTLLAG